MCTAVAALDCDGSPSVQGSGPLSSSPQDPGTADCGCCGVGCVGPPPPVDAGATIPPSTPPIPVAQQSAGGPCVTSIDCAGGLVCGYDPDGGCASPGECVAQVSGPAGPPACGCDGTPVQYVAPGYTSVPVASPTACEEDSGVTTGDGGVDGGDVDAGEND